MYIMRDEVWKGLLYSSCKKMSSEAMGGEDVSLRVCYGWPQDKDAHRFRGSWMSRKRLI